jgi:hypothetical protein
MRTCAGCTIMLINVETKKTSSGGSQVHSEFLTHWFGMCVESIRVQCNFGAGNLWFA